MELALLIVGMAGVTFAARYSMIFIMGRWDVPPIITRALTFVPMAAFAALIAPELLLREDQIVLLNPRLVAGIVAIIVAALTRNTLLTIVIGMGSLWLAQSLVR